MKADDKPQPAQTRVLRTLTYGGPDDGPDGNAGDREPRRPRPRPPSLSVSLDAPTAVSDASLVLTEDDLAVLDATAG
ncbi:MAG: hypothetical protein ABI083_01770 [Lapillicoccus sp.]